MNKINLDLIIRGFLYRENWTPLSTRKKWFQNYTIDFLQCSHRYQLLLDKLKNKYNINLYFSTYDTTPNNNIEKIKNLYNPTKIFFSIEKDSSQFTTAVAALKTENISNSNNLLMLIRSDMLVTNKFIDIIYNQNFDTEALYVLCKEKNRRDKVIDTIHIIPKNIKSQFLKYISIPKLRHAHKIHKFIYTNVISSQHQCTSTDGCKEFFSLYHGL